PPDLRSAMDDDPRLARPAALGGERRPGLELAHEVVRRGRGVGASRRDPAPGAGEATRALAERLRDGEDLEALGQLLERIEPYAYAQPGALDDSLEAAKDREPCGGQLVGRVRADDRPDERGRRHGYPPAMHDAAALELAKRAAFRGGRVALAKLGDPGYLTWKGQRDVVTGATLEVQQAIVSVLQNECPDDAILVEEGPEDEPLAVDAERLWIVDPICGTLSFAQGIPFFAVSIALRVEGVLRVGVVYDPVRDETFAARIGEPATLNGRPITVMNTALGPEFWEQAWVATDLPLSGPERDTALRIFGLFAKEVMAQYIW